MMISPVIGRLVDRMCPIGFVRRQAMCSLAIKRHQVEFLVVDSMAIFSDSSGHDIHHELTQR